MLEYGRSPTRPGYVTVVRTYKGVSTKLSSVYLSMVDIAQDQVMLQLSEHVKESIHLWFRPYHRPRSVTKSEHPKE